MAKKPTPAVVVRPRQQQRRSEQSVKNENDRYRLSSFAAEEGTIKSSVLTDLELEVSTVFDL